MPELMGSGGSYLATEKPESATAFSRSACFALASSYLTVTRPFSRFTVAVSTPSNAFSFAAVLGGHWSHSQPLTLMVSVFVAASPAVLAQSPIANPNRALFMASSFTGNAEPELVVPCDNSVNSRGLEDLPDLALERRERGGEAGLDRAWPGKLHRQLGRHPSRARREHHDPVGEVERFFHVVSHEEHRLPPLRPEPRQLVLHPRARLGIQRAERLVEEKDGRVGREHARHLDQLRHPRGQFLRIRRLERREPDPLEQLVAYGPPRRRQQPLREQTELDVLAHRHPGKDRVFLEDVPPLPARALDARAVAAHRSAQGLEEAGQDPEQSRLSAPHRAQHRQELIVIDVKGQAFQRLGPPRAGIGVAQIERLQPPAGGAASRHAVRLIQRVALACAESTSRSQASTSAPMVAMAMTIVGTRG